jgi:predicted oxidoreductase (fatty acid repression mutant protein)
VILFGDSHHKFWEIVRETLRKIVPEAAFAATSGKIDSFWVLVQRYFMKTKL